MKFLVASLTLLVLICFNGIPTAALKPDSGQVLAYQMTPGATMRYKLVANIKGAMPLFDQLTPVDLEAMISFVYLATPKTVQPDGAADVEFQVESADVEISKVPFPVPIEDVQKVLNQTVTFSKTGQVRKITGGSKVPFSVSIPGVDPKRLYALIFPIVFQATAVKPGDSWPFVSEMLGGGNTKPSFTAKVLPPDPAWTDGKMTKLGESFEMKVDQKLDANKKATTVAAKIHKTRTGLISGSGFMNFDRTAGLFTKSFVSLNAKITENLIGKKLTPDEPRQVISTVNAKVTVELQPNTTASEAVKKDKP